MPNKDNRELLSLGPEQAVTSLQELSPLPASLFQCFIIFIQTRSFFGLFTPKNEQKYEGIKLF